MSPSTAAKRSASPPACAPANAAVRICSIAARTKISLCSRDWPRRVSGRYRWFHRRLRSAKGAGVSLTKLGALTREHAHLAPAQWLRRERVRQACELLLPATPKWWMWVTKRVLKAIGVPPPVLWLTRMTPGAYRALIQRVPAAIAAGLSRQGSAGLSRPRSRKPVREKPGQ